MSGYISDDMLACEIITLVQQSGDFEQRLAVWHVARMQGDNSLVKDIYEALSELYPPVEDIAQVTRVLQRAQHVLETHVTEDNQYSA